MKSTRIPLLAASILAAAAFAAPAAAQSNRTWVSRTGSDASATCAIATPCLTFQGAHDKTNAGGLVSCLDSGDFGILTITKSITIKCVGVTASIVATTGNAINIAAGASDKIVIDGLDLEGQVNAGNGISTFNTTGASKVHILNMAIRNFPLSGVQIGAVSNSHFFIDNSFLIGNTTGVRVAGTNNIASLTNSSVRASPSASLNAATATAIIGAQNSVINDSPVGIQAVAGAQVISVGPSNLITGAGSFTLTIPYQ